MISGLKSCIFTPRLVVFNETFASIKEKELKEGKVSTAKDKHYAVLWDESTAGSNKEHVTNAYLSLIKKEMQMPLCSGQVIVQHRTKPGACIMLWQFWSTLIMESTA